MPAVSSKQQKFMAICSHNPKHAKGKCPPKKVAHEFSFKAKGKAVDQAEGLEK